MNGRVVLWQPTFLLYPVFSFFVVPRVFICYIFHPIIEAYFGLFFTRVFLGIFCSIRLRN